MVPVTVATGDEPRHDKEAKPHGSVSEISEWALAGVVWGDASFAKKMSIAVAKQTNDMERLAELKTQIGRLDQIIAATSSGDGTEEPYQQSVKIGKEIDAGVTNGPEGPAIAQNIREFSGLAENEFTSRDAETRSDSLPYSRNSL